MQEAGAAGEQTNFQTDVEEGGQFQYQSGDDDTTNLVGFGPIGALRIAY